AKIDADQYKYGSAIREFRCFFYLTGTLSVSTLFGAQEAIHPCSVFLYADRAAKNAFSSAAKFKYGDILKNIFN
ncbi:hypothetical protein, partial [Sutterella wadsworthensis]|uniref:hypothetical protein n=1 Tax=Sutterella wadsworthensis TaxID=40545 RepID=UPI003966BD81